MASALPWDLLPGLNHWGMGVGGEDPTSPKLTTGRGSEAQLFPETHPWGMESGSGTGRWGGGLPVLLLGVWWRTLSCCQALPPPPPPPPLSPNQAVHRSKLFSSLECSPGI